MRRLRAFVDWLLGERCQGCRQRVFNRDAVRHYAYDCPAVHR